MIAKHLKAKTVDGLRPIALLNICYKVYARLLNTRVRKSLDAHQPPSQAGFRKGFSVDHHLLALTLLVERVHEYNLQLWAISIDLSKAFGRVNWNKLWDALHAQQLPEYLVSALQSIYSDQMGVVKGSSNDTSAPFPIQRGVKQGCPLSPGLFNAILQFVMERWEHQIHQLGIGLNINEYHLSNLRFADDILLLATSKDDVVCMLEILTLELGEIGLILNTKKTKVLTTEVHDFNHIVLHDGSRIDVIPDFDCHRWLGKAICFFKKFEANRGMSQVQR